MSLVGTRPPTVDEWDKYELHHRARLATKPGLTGMWQVSGRSNITDLVDATNFIKTVEQHQHRKIACLEEIAYLNGWISKEEVLKVYEVLKKNQYGQYLKDVLDGKYQEHLY